MYKISQIVDKENILHNDFIDKELKKELKGENWIESIKKIFNLPPPQAKVILLKFKNYKK